MNTILAGASGGLTAAICKPLIFGNFSRKHRYDVGALCNGLLAGLVAITGCCHSVSPAQSVLIGLIGGLIYSASSRLNKALNIDDPIEASNVHGFCGMWGLIAVGIFDNGLGLVSDSPDKGSFFGW